MAERGFGVAAGLDPEVAVPLARRCAGLGYGSIWSNDHPGAKGLETLADFADGNDELDLGVAVIALDRRTPDEIAEDIVELGLDRERLYAVAAEFAGLTGSERVFDLFCGIGTIGLSMAGRAGEVWGVEIVPEAIADAERNAKLNEIGNAHFLAANVRTGVRPLLVQAGKPDVVVIDPPRAGLSQKMIRRVIECEAKRIVYVSCNPTTLAPNAAQLTEAGYRLRRVRPVDMFPQTPHIECVALLERG